MKYIRNVFLIILMTGVFALGSSCNDDDNGSSNVPDDVCNFGTCNVSEANREACINAYQECTSAGGSDTECRTEAREKCI